MSDPSITIVIPAYNVAKYLREALESIKKQTVYPNEVILVDDGSNDETIDVANSFEFPFPYKVISIENGGQGNARNLGVSLANSEYIYYFDSDDILNNCFIERIKKEIVINKRPDIALFSGKSFNDEEYQGSRWVNYSRNFSGYFTSRLDFLEMSYKNKALFCSPCLYVSKRGMWGASAFEFGPNYFEDEAIFFPLLFSCKTYLVLNDVFFYRRNREGSTMTIKPSLKHALGSLCCVNRLIELCKCNSIENDEFWHIKKRLEDSLVSYISISRNAGFKVNYNKILKSLFIIKNGRATIRALYYLLGINKLNFKVKS